MDAQGDGATGQTWQAGHWLADGSLEAVAEINMQCLELLVGMSAAEAPCRLPLVAEQVAAWRALPAAACARLAASPYLLADAGFDDEVRWRCLEPGMVRDLPAQFVEPSFVGTGAHDFIRRVLVLGWHLARANRQLARVVFGMPLACAERVSLLRLQDLDWLAQHRPGCVRPRWEGQARIWRHLLQAACDQDRERLTQASLRGLQLMASGVLGSATGAGPKGRRREGL
jgi:hypothetical protein